MSRGVAPVTDVAEESSVFTFGVKQRSECLFSLISPGEECTTLFRNVGAVLFLDNFTLKMNCVTSKRL